MSSQPQVMVGFMIYFTTDLAHYALQIQPSTAAAGRFEVVQMQSLGGGKWKATKADRGMTTYGVEIGQVFMAGRDDQIVTFGKVRRIEKVTCTVF